MNKCINIGRDKSPNINWKQLMVEREKAQTKCFPVRNLKKKKLNVIYNCGCQQDPCHFAILTQKFRSPNINWKQLMIEREKATQLFPRQNLENTKFSDSDQIFI